LGIKVGEGRHKVDATNMILNTENCIKKRRVTVPFMRITSHVVFFSRTAEEMLKLVAGDKVSFYIDGRHYLYFDARKGFPIGYLNKSKRRTSSSCESYSLVIHNKELCGRLLLIFKTGYMRIGEFAEGRYMLHPIDKNYCDITR